MDETFRSRAPVSVVAEDLASEGELGLEDHEIADMLVEFLFFMRNRASDLIISGNEDAALESSRQYWIVARMVSRLAELLNSNSGEIIN